MLAKILNKEFSCRTCRFRRPGTYDPKNYCDAQDMDPMPKSDRWSTTYCELWEPQP